MNQHRNQHRGLVSRKIVLGLLTCFPLFCCATARADDAAGKPADEKQKIESLIAAVASLTDATFIRNGTEYDCKAAANHMRTKWRWKSSEIKTARDFIRVAASKSSESGKPYLIRFKGGKEVTSESFLTDKLKSIEAPAKEK